MANGDFGSFNVWHIEFLCTYLKDLVVSERVVFMLWFCPFLFCLIVCLFVWLDGWVGWLVWWMVDLFGLLLSCFVLGWFVFSWLVGWLDVGLFGFLVVWWFLDRLIVWLIYFVLSYFIWFYLLLFWSSIGGLEKNIYRKKIMEWNSL